MNVERRKPELDSLLYLGIAFLVALWIIFFWRT